MEYIYILLEVVKRKLNLLENIITRETLCWL